MIGRQKGGFSMEIAFSDGIKIIIDDDKLSSWDFKRDGRVEFYMTDKFKYIVDRNVGVLV